MNPCETAAQLLPDYWSDALQTPERASDHLWLRRHLESCADCSSLVAFWRQMAALPEVPRDGARERHQRVRFDQMLAAYQAALASSHAPARNLGRRGWLMNPVPMMAAAALLIVGLGAGWFLRGNAAPATLAATSVASNQQAIADLRQQVQASTQLAVLSLLRQQSASDRLQGVSYSTAVTGSDPSVTSALLHSLNYDSSPDVRLAALDALQRQATEPVVRQGLLEAFHFQKSPLLQIALVDSFVETHDAAARGLLRQVSTSGTYNPEVRQRAAWGLAQPIWN
ncbi:MAG TPA: hypothetical protein VN709_04645 [Terriglobales bacterium]|nr:hypothetical protein [Terriglobales bacterium]